MICNYRYRQQHICLLSNCCSLELTTLQPKQYQYRRSCIESADYDFKKRSLCSKCTIHQQGYFVMLLFQNMKISVQN